MRSKGLISVLTVVCVAAFIWMAQEAAGQLLLGGKKEWLAWRAHHVNTVLIIWVGVTVILLVALAATVGRRMLKALDQQQRAAAEAKGMGRIFHAALRGDEGAADKLVLLLKDQSRAVRLQAARALAVLDDEDVNPTLLRIVKYWPGNDKLDLIDVLRRENDIRVGKVLKEFTHDRNPMVARKALSALAIVGRVSKGVMKGEDERRRGRAGRSLKRSRPEAAPVGASAPDRPASGPARTTARVAKPEQAGTPVKAATPAQDRRPTRPAAPARPGTSASVNDDVSPGTQPAKRAPARKQAAPKKTPEVPGDETQASTLPAGS